MNEKKIRWNRLLIIIGILLLLSGMILPCSALRVYGVKYADNVSPGETVYHTMIVENRDPENSVDIDIAVMGFGQSLQNNYLTLKPIEDTSAYSARPFINLDRSHIHLGPGESQRVTATISIPQNVGSGGRYALISVVSGSRGSVGVGITGPVLITIAESSISETGSITDLGVVDPVAGKPITISTILKNTGNHHYYHATNEVTLTDLGGDVIANTSTPPCPAAIIPTYSVQFDAPIKTPLDAGTYIVQSKMFLEDGTLLDEKSTTIEVKEAYLPPLTEESVKLVPGEAATLAAPDGSIKITFPPDAVLGSVTVILKAVSSNQVPSLPESYKFGSVFFRIDGLSGLLYNDATVTVRYTEEDLAHAEGEPLRLALGYWDEIKKEWTVLPTEVNRGDMTLSTSTNHLSTWAVVVKPTAETSGGLTAIPIAGYLPFIALFVILFWNGLRKGKRG